MKALFEASALIILAVAALYAFWRARWGYPDPAVPAVLTYHKITSFELGGTWVSRQRFERQIRSLLDSGYRFIDEKTFIDTIEGKREAGPREILLTFDDGYESFATEAAPVLERLGVPALVFLVVNFIGEENGWELGLPGRKARHMDLDTILDLRRRGFSFGSHGLNHIPLTHIPGDMALDLLKMSKSLLETVTGAEVLSYSYPYGRADSAAAALASEAGYRAAYTLYPKGRAGVADPHLVRREGVWVIDTPAVIRTKLSRKGLFWLEDIKGRMINSVADLTILIKKRGY